MKRKYVGYKLPPELVDRLNLEADRLGVTRTAFVEAALEKELVSSEPRPAEGKPLVRTVFEYMGLPVVELEDVPPGVVVVPQRSRQPDPGRVARIVAGAQPDWPDGSGLRESSLSAADARLRRLRG